jgi:signal transduction histidine kinase
MAVTDSGIGLSTEEQAQLFTRFYRAPNVATKGIGGTGLGLAITRSLVEMQGGEIQVTSEPGHGSTFRFTLPLAYSERA